MHFTSGRALLVAALLSSAPVAAEPPKSQDPRWSCGGGTSPTYRINVYSDALEVLQSSPTARYAALRYSLAEAAFPKEPTDKAKFECTSQLPEQKTVMIKVYGDRATVQQSSPTARFALISYRLTPR